MQSIPDLVQASTFIFSGTVMELRASTVPIMAPGERLITVRLDQDLRVAPVLGDLRGSAITVAVESAEQFEPGQRAVFFSNSSVHGRGIMVTEVAHLDVGQADAVATAVAELPRRHLVARLEDAAVVLNATVTSIDPPGFTFDQHDGLWAAAHLQVKAELKGSAPSPPVVHFATAQWPPYDRFPRLELKQAGVFLLHQPAIGGGGEGGTLPDGALAALDLADVQAPAEAARIKRLLTALG